MNKTHKRMRTLLVILAVMAVMMGGYTTALAEGTTTIHVSDSAIDVGDSLSVTVTATETGSMSVTYNAEVLEFVGSSADYTVDGNVITVQGDSVSLSFKGTGEGTSSIIVASPTLTGSSTSISVQGAAVDTAQTQQLQTQDAITTSAAEGQFTIDGVGYVVSERYADSMIPAGFTRTTVTIDGYGYKELSNGTITLLYLKKASDTASDGTFYVYDADSNSVSPFQMLGTADNYVLLQTPEQLLSASMTQTTLLVNDTELPVYSLGTESDFYFVYGTNQDGVTGWYQYDSLYGTLQRVNEQLLTTGDDISEDEDMDTVQTTEDDKLSAKIAKQRYWIAALIFVLVVLGVVVLNLFLGRKQERDEEQDEEYDAEDEDILETEDASAEEIPAEEETSDDSRFYARDTSEVKAMFSTEEEHAQWAALNTEETSEEDEEVLDIFAEHEEDVPQEDTVETVKETKAAEPFRSKKDTRYKTDADAQIEILDLNNL